MSAFSKWFQAQHGPRKLWRHEDHELQLLIDQAHGAQAELDRRREWDHREQSALYAWAAARNINQASAGDQVSSAPVDEVPTPGGNLPNRPGIELETDSQFCKHDDGDCHADDPCDDCPKYKGDLQT